MLSTWPCGISRASFSRDLCLLCWGARQRYILSGGGGGAVWYYLLPMQERLPVYSTTAEPKIAKVTHADTLSVHNYTRNVFHMNFSHSWFLGHHAHTHTHEQDLGFVGAKIPCAYGPADGDEGLAKNVEIFRRARESVGPDYPLMWASGSVFIWVGGGGDTVCYVHVYSLETLDCTQYLGSTLD